MEEIEKHMMLELLLQVEEESMKQKKVAYLYLEKENVKGIKKLRLIIWT